MVDVVRCRNDVLAVVEVLYRKKSARLGSALGRWVGSGMTMQFIALESPESGWVGSAGAPLNDLRIFKTMPFTEI